MIYTVTLNPSIDYVVHMDSLVSGITNRTTGEEYYFGGKGINVSNVLSELDLDRQKFLVSEIDDVQLFITSAELNDEVIRDLRGGTLFRIEDGSVTRVDKY